MTPATFKRRILAEGFDPFDHPLQYPTFSRVKEAQTQYVCRDAVRGGAWRLFLGFNTIPAADIRTPEHAAECESPWFQYCSDAAISEFGPEPGILDKRQALNAAWQWLTEVGFTWLADPFAHTPDYWRREHNILPKNVV